MYKKNLFIILFAFLFIFLVQAQSRNSGTNNLQLHIRESVEQISQLILEKYPEMSVKKGVVILGFEEESPQAKKKKMGTLIQVYLEEVLTNSMLLYLVDRKNMDAIQEEYALALSGMVDESTAPELGYLSGAQHLLYGSVIEENSDFRVSISMTDTTTGELLLTRNYDTPAPGVLISAVYTEVSPLHCSFKDPGPSILCK